MKKYPFLTDKFYSSTFETLSVFNAILKSKLDDDKDMYTSGTYLSMGVKDCEQSRIILSKLISDFPAYEELNKSRGYAPLSLNTLQEIHLETFGPGDEIMWDSEREEFEFRCAFENEED